MVFKGPYGGVYEPDFYTALNAGQLTHLSRESIKKRFDSDVWLQIERVYDAFIQTLNCGKEGALSKIPLNIHLIWLEPSSCKQLSLPFDVEKVVQSYCQFHPKSEGWKVTVWGTKESEALIHRFSRQFPNLQEVYEKAESVAEKADIARCCLLYDQGGFYSDTDLPCLGNLRELHQFSDFYCSIESLLFPEISCGNAAIGSCEGHPILGSMLQKMRPRGPEEDRGSVLYRTGPQLLSQQVREFLQEGTKPYTSLVLPPSYFFPLPYGRSLSDFGKASMQQAKDWVLPWSKGVHLWNGSWNN